MPDRPGRRSVGSWLAGLLVALSVGAIGWQFAQTNPQEWKATTQLLVVPESSLKSGQVPGYWETLTTGQVSATAAGIIGEPGYLDDAMEELGMVKDDSVTATVAVVPATLLIEVVVEAPQPFMAERLADEIPRRALSDVNSQLDPYATRSLGSAAGTAERTGIAPVQFAAAVAVAALVAGVAVQQAWQQLVLVRRRTPR